MREPSKVRARALLVAAGVAIAPCSGGEGSGGGPPPTTSTMLPDTTHVVTPMPEPQVAGPCRVSWYDTPGETASGTVFDRDAMTAAHRTLPFGTRVRVVYSGRSVTVTVTDRGPYVGNRELDLTPAAFAQLAELDTGILNARCEIYGGL